MTQTTSKIDAARTNYHYLAESLRGLEVDLRWGLENSDRVPAAWAEIAQEPAVPVKMKLTLRLDADVVKFFRAAGQGHLTRMNRVLRAYMLARLAGVVKGAEAVRYVPLPMEAYTVEMADLTDLTLRRNALARAGQDVVATDVEIDRRLQRLAALKQEAGVGDDHQ